MCTSVGTARVKWGKDMEKGMAEKREYVKKYSRHEIKKLRKT